MAKMVMLREYFEELRKQGHRRKALARLLADLDILGNEGLSSKAIAVRSLGEGLWEIRRIYQGVFYRVLFCIHHQEVWLLHAFEKETRKTPLHDLELARSRMAQIRSRR